MTVPNTDLRSRDARGLRFLLSVVILLSVTCAARPTPLPIPRGGVPLDTPAGPAVPAWGNGDAAATGAGSSENPLLRPMRLSPADILERSSPAIVTIMSVLPEEGAVRGSGFFATPRGLIVTSHHLVDGARSISVKTRDGKVYDKVKVRIAKPNADLAVLELTGLARVEPYLPLADSELVRVGEPIVAIGHPLGLEYSVSSGIVSALRAAEIHGLDLIQFSAPVSPGCSGGPVLNSAGQVIGIICLSHPEGQNLNFAIPINYVRQLLAGADGPPSFVAAMRGLDVVTPIRMAFRAAAGKPSPVPSGLDLVPQTPTVMVNGPLSRRTFRAGTRGFTVSCPVSWTCHSERSGEGLTVRMESADGLVHVELSTVLLRAETALSAWAQKAMRAVNSMVLSSDLAESESVTPPLEPRLVRESQQTVGGVSWKMYVHQFNDADGNDDYAVTMFSVSGDHGYMVRYVAPVAAWNRVRGAIEQVVASAQIF